MKKFNKGMVITSTIAAALAAVTLAGCGSTAEKAVPGTAAETRPVSVTAPVSAEAAKEVKAAEEKPAETTAAKKTAKKTTTKKSAAKKDTNKTAKKKTSKKTETTKKAAQPAAVTQKTQPAQTKKAAETPAKKTKKKTAAPKTVIPEEVYPVWVEGDMYAGTYYEENAGRGSMDITRNSDGTYSVSVRWSSSAYETNFWNFSGEFDGRGAMNYTNCRMTTETYDENGHMTPCTIYTKGSGYIKFLDEGVLIWNDDMGDICPGTTFVANKVNYNTKADEVGTAGSNYYENEAKYNTKADEVGTAGSNYYENEYGYNTKADEVGTAGSNYYENEYGYNTKADEVGTAGSNYYEFVY